MGMGELGIIACSRVITGTATIESVITLSIDVCETITLLYSSIGEFIYRTPIIYHLLYHFPGYLNKVICNY